MQRQGRTNYKPAACLERDLRPKSNVAYSWKPSSPSTNVFMVSSTCRLCASCSTGQSIFSIRTAISQPTHFCFSVARLRQAGGE